MDKRRNYPALVTVEEVLQQSEKYLSVQEVDFARQVRTAFLETRGNGKFADYETWNTVCSLGAIFIAGRIQGIREERQRRKKQQR